MPDQWVISGKVTRGRGHRPVPNIKIAAFDAEADGDVVIYESVTDEGGDFNVEYGEDDFACAVHAVVLKVIDDDGNVLVKSRRIGRRPAHRRVFLNLPSPRPTVAIGGTDLDEEALDNLDPDAFINAIRHVIGVDADDDDAGSTLRSLSPELAPEELEQQPSLTPVMWLFRRIIDRNADKPGWGEVRRMYSDTMSSLLEAADATHPCDPFLIHYHTAGDDAPLAGDAGGDIKKPVTGAFLEAIPPDSGIPDYIEKLCFWLNHALTKYTNAPISLKNPADVLTPNPIDVVVKQLNGSAGPHWDHAENLMVIGNKYPDDKLALVPAHELMHAVQGLCYSDNVSDTDLWLKPMREGGAVLVEDSIFDEVNRYIYTANQGAALSVPFVGLTTGKGYDACLLLKYIAEQQSPNVGVANEPNIGIETYRSLLEECSANGATTDTLSDAARSLPWFQTFCRFKYLDGAERDETSAETVLGNYWLAIYLKDLPIHEQDRRFRFMEQQDQTTWDRDLGTDAATAKPLGKVLVFTDTLAAGESVSFGDPLNPFAATYYKVAIDGDVSTFRLDFDWVADTRPIIQAVLVEKHPGDGNGDTYVVRDILRSDKAKWCRTIANKRGDHKLEYVLIIVASTESAGTYTLDLDKVDDAPDVMVTKWHHEVEKSYEIDSMNWAWTWISPDIWVDGVVTFGVNNKLKIRLRNQGLVAAEGVEVEFWYQDAAGGLDDAKWQDVVDAVGAVQKLTSLNIAAGGEVTEVVNWAPAESGTSNHFCVRAVVTGPASDTNTDNKRVLSNFGNVQPPPGPFPVPIARNDALFQPWDYRLEVIARTFGGWVPNLRDIAVARRRPGPRPDGKPVVDVVRIEPRVGEPRRRPAGRSPDPLGHYETNPKALPPGLEGVPMVTIVQYHGSECLGGFTWAIREEGQG